jgi:CheY-like chemotaxis protein
VTQSILVIEDETKDFDSIRERLQKNGFSVERLGSLNKERLYNYKALHPESNVIVVDLNLQQLAEFDTEEGLKLIRDELWPVDRTTLFVIFSRYELKLDNLPKLVEPHWCYVKKEIDPDTNGLSSECLNRLTDIIITACKSTPAYLETPKFNMLELISEYEQFRKVSSSFNPHDGPRQSMIMSVDLLDRIANGAIGYARAGALANHVGLAVFGSCGRLELRDHSDIEMCAYYTEDDEGLAKQMAVLLWNRATKLIVANGRRFEGEQLVKDNPDGLLNVNQVGEDLPNRFLPVLAVAPILDLRASRAPQIRNRRLQILTEARAIFNPRLVNELKLNLLPKAARDARDVIQSLEWREMLDQFSLDTAPLSLQSSRDYKGIVLRTLNLMTLRFELVRQLCVTHWNADLFLREISDPAVLKLARFANWWSSRSKNQEISQLLIDAVQHYRLIWDRFDEPAVPLNENIRPLADNLCNCLEKLAFQEETRFLKDGGYEWLFLTNTMRQLMTRL